MFWDNSERCSEATRMGRWKSCVLSRLHRGGKEKEGVLIICTVILSREFSRQPQEALLAGGRGSSQ